MPICQTTYSPVYKTTFTPFQTDIPCVGEPTTLVSYEFQNGVDYTFQNLGDYDFN